jgi:hypothetical protein
MGYQRAPYLCSCSYPGNTLKGYATKHRWRTNTLKVHEGPGSGDKTEVLTMSHSLEAAKQLHWLLESAYSPFYFYRARHIHKNM